MLLAGLAEISDTQTFDLIRPLMDQPAIRAEAQLAALNVASHLAEAEIQNLSAAIKAIGNTAANETIRHNAEAILTQFAPASDFLTTWQVAGPFRRNGKDATALFDMGLPPETDKGPPAKWRALVVSRLPKTDV